MDLLTGPLPVHEQPGAISRFVVRATAEAAGRGPTKARAYVMDDVIAVVLRDTLTRPERRLLSDQPAALLASRRALHATMRGKLIDGIEVVTARTVSTLHIDHQIEQDVIAVTFVMVDEATASRDRDR